MNDPLAHIYENLENEPYIEPPKSKEELKLEELLKQVLDKMDNEKLSTQEFLKLEADMWHIIYAQLELHEPYYTKKNSLMDHNERRKEYEKFIQKEEIDEAGLNCYDIQD